MITSKITTKIITAATIALMAFGTFASPSQARSRAYCDAYARDVASRYAGGQQILGGAVGGAIAGGLLGAVIGGRHSVETGAIVGGVGGTVVGGAYANKKWRKVYNRAYADCRSY